MSASTEEGGLLTPFRVLDLTTDLGFLCGKILADLGADVIKIERPGGDPARTIGPFFHDEPHPEKSLYWFAYNANKRGITLDIAQPRGQELFARLAKTADFVVESFPPCHLQGLGLGYEALAQINLRVILVSITPYGQKGPYAHYKAGDLEIMAASGFMRMIGDPDRAPVRVSLSQSPLWASLFGTIGALMAHYHREARGQGQHVDASAQASMLWAYYAPIFWDVNRQLSRREGVFLSGRSVTGSKMRNIWPCKDGYLTFALYGGPAGVRTNQALVAWMEEKGMAPDFLREIDWSRYDIAIITQEEVDRLEAAIGPFLVQLTTQEFFEEVVKRDMLGYPVATPKEIMADPQLEEREFWQRVEHPELGVTLFYPGLFAKFSQGSPSQWRRAPLIGEHNEEIYRDELGLSAQEIAALKAAQVI